MRLGRRYRFSAAHRLDSPALGVEQNAAVYGKCNNPFGHGHDYALEIALDGPLDVSTGRVADRAALDHLVESAVLSRLRHADLNTDARDFAGAVPTTENLAEGIWRALRDRWSEAFPGGSPALAAVRLHETRRNTIEVQVPKGSEATQCPAS